MEGVPLTAAPLVVRPLLAFGRDEILAYVTIDTLKHSPEYARNYVNRRVSKGIRLRGIYNNTPELQQYLANNKGELRTSKVISEKKFPIHNEINIYANKIIINTYHPGPFGIMIESKEAAETQRTIFELAWQGIPNTT